MEDHSIQNLAALGQRMRTPPRFLFLEVNKRCNLRCQHCEFWLRNDNDRDSYLSPTRKSEIIAEFAEMSPFGSIVVCGGEPMLDLDEYFAICRDARGHGLRVLSVVNGTRERLRAVLVTALLASLGLLPAAMSHAIGSETQRPIAVVVVGGTISAALLTLIVLPVTFYLACLARDALERRRAERTAAVAA